MWDNADGRVSLWNTTDPNPIATCTIAGPYTGWAGVAIGIGPDNHERLLWDNVSGQAAVWNLSDANPAATCLLYGPYSGWTAKTLSVGDDNAAHLLWDNVSGQVSLWNLSDANPAATCVLAGPYSGWSGQDLSVGSDNKGRSAVGQRQRAELALEPRRCQSGGDLHCGRAVQRMDRRVRGRRAVKIRSSTGRTWVFAPFF